MFDKYAHLRKLHVAFKTAEGPPRMEARRALLLEGVRLDLTFVGLSEVLYTQKPGGAVN